MNFAMVFSMANDTFWFGRDGDKMFQNFEHFSKFCMNEVNEDR